jgi:hypothetical protein
MLEASLENNRKLFDAAADALRQIDPVLQPWAMAIWWDQNLAAVQRAKVLGTFGEPLTPLLIGFAWQAYQRNPGQSGTAVKEASQVLPDIAPKDQAAVEFLAHMLTEQAKQPPLVNADVREAIIISLQRMEHAILATEPLLQVARDSRTPVTVRACAVETLLAIEKRPRNVDALQKQKDALVYARIRAKLWELRNDPCEPVRSLITANERKLRA